MIPARAFDAAARITRSIGRDPRLMIELAVWRLTLPWLKHVVGVKTLTRMMWAEPVDPPPGAVPRAIDIVTTSGRLFLSANCLERSLVWYRVLSRAGARPRLVMGARRDERLSGHVWIELNGEPFGEPDAARYVPIVAFDRRGQEQSPGVTA